MCNLPASFKCTSCTECPAWSTLSLIFYICDCTLCSPIDFFGCVILISLEYGIVLLVFVDSKSKVCLFEFFICQIEEHGFSISFSSDFSVVGSCNLSILSVDSESVRFFLWCVFLIESSLEILESNSNWINIVGLEVYDST